MIDSVNMKVKPCEGKFMVDFFVKEKYLLYLLEGSHRYVNIQCDIFILAPTFDIKDLLLCVDMSSSILYHKDTKVWRRKMTILLSQNNSRNYDYVKDSFSVILKVETSPFLLLYLVHGVNKKLCFQQFFLFSFGSH